MAEEKRVERVCVITTFDEENYVAGKTYQVSQDLLARYPDSFRAPDWKDPAEQAKKSTKEKTEDLQRKTQEEFEKARDYQSLLDAQSAEVQERQRQELTETVRKRRAEDRQADREGVESTGWKPKAPPAAREPTASKKTRQSPGPGHALPRAERLKDEP